MKHTFVPDPECYDDKIGGMLKQLSLYYYYYFICNLQRASQKCKREFKESRDRTSSVER